MSEPFEQQVKDAEEGKLNGRVGETSASVEDDKYMLVQGESVEELATKLRVFISAEAALAAHGRTLAIEQEHAVLVESLSKANEELRHKTQALELSEESREKMRASLSRLDEICYPRDKPHAGPISTETLKRYIMASILWFEATNERAGYGVSRVMLMGKASKHLTANGWQHDGFQGWMKPNVVGKKLAFDAIRYDMEELSKLFEHLVE